MNNTDISIQANVMCYLPVPLLGALLGAPHGSLVLDAPSPKGSLEGESEGGAGDPQASSALAGAAAKKDKKKTVAQIGCSTDTQIDGFTHRHKTRTKS